MKRCVGLGLIAAAALACHAAGETGQMSLQVKKGDLRETPSFLGKVKASAAYGDRFTVIEKRGDWIQVSGGADGSTRGWLHQSALTAKRVQLKAGEADAQVAASSGELALAGKGFNSDVESEFKKTNKAADFATVDKMVKIKIDAEVARKFLDAGKVVPEGGAR